MPSSSHPLGPKVLRILTQHGEMTRSQLAEALASDSDVSTDDRRQSEVVLHHRYPPKLDDENYIDYDQRSGVVVLWGEPHDIESRLEAWGL